jgi:hypothetical protein
MTVALKESGARENLNQSGGRLFDPGGPRSLDECVSAVWGALALRGNAHCLVCGATLAGGEDEAECAGCGSSLA